LVHNKRYRTEQKDHHTRSQQQHGSQRIRKKDSEAKKEVEDEDYLLFTSKGTTEAAIIKPTDLLRPNHITITMTSGRSSVHLALLALMVPIANGWVMPNVQEVSRSRRVCLSWDTQAISPSTCPMVSSTTTLFGATVEDDEDEEIMEYLDEDDEDDDDYDPEAALAKQAEWMDQLHRLAQTTSNDPSAVAVAQEIFDDMFTAYAESNDSTFFPTTEVYNLILEIHAFSRSPDGAEEGERILSRMEDKSNDFVARPNEETYLRVMDAWANREEPDKVQKILERQEAPTTTSYNKLIKAYGIANDFEQADALFRSMLAEGKVNHKSWVQLMKARMVTEDSESEETVESIFEEMEEEGYDPETDAYNVLIRYIGKRPQGPQDAEAMLFEMIGRFRKGEEELKPNSDTFRAVLSAYNGRGRRFTSASMAAKVEQIMQIRNGLLTPEESGSDERIYRMALGIIGRCKDSKKAVRANRMLQKYNGESLYLQYLVLKACAYTDGNSEDKFEAFQVALGIIKKLRSTSQVEIDSSITGMFIKACNKLMPAGRKRDDIVKKMFQDCCTNGLVNDFVLNEFALASSDSLRLEILGGSNAESFDVPGDWNRNVAP
jgi:pentatricopeptide repeat protein